jgi:hypothetical protein
VAHLGALGHRWRCWAAHRWVHVNIRPLEFVYATQPVIMLLSMHCMQHAFEGGTQATLQAQWRCLLPRATFASRGACKTKMHLYFHPRNHTIYSKPCLMADKACTSHPHVPLPSLVPPPAAHRCRWVCLQPLATCTWVRWHVSRYPHTSWSRQSRISQVRHNIDVNMMIMPLSIAPAFSCMHDTMVVTDRQAVPQ